LKVKVEFGIKKRFLHLKQKFAQKLHGRPKNKIFYRCFGEKLKANMVEP
jgi:hypothetical protein